MENHRNEIEVLKKWSKFIFHISPNAKEYFEIANQGESIDFTAWTENNERTAALLNHFLKKKYYIYSIKTVMSIFGLVVFFIEDSDAEAFEKDMIIAGKFLNDLFKPAIKRIQDERNLDPSYKTVTKSYPLTEIDRVGLEKKKNISLIENI